MSNDTNPDEHLANILSGLEASTDPQEFRMYLRAILRATEHSARLLANLAEAARKAVR